MNPPHVLGDQARTDTHAISVAEDPTNPAGDHRSSDTHVCRVAGGPDSLPGHYIPETQVAGAGQGTSIDTGHMVSASHTCDAGVEPFIRNDQVTADTHGHNVVAEQSPRPTKQGPAPNVSASDEGHTPPAPTTRVAVSNDDSSVLADPDDQQGPASSYSEPTTPTRVLSDPFLALAADVLDDLENVRKANANRLGTLLRATTDSDGQERGWGLSEEHPSVARIAGLVEALHCGRSGVGRKGCCLEHDATRQLQAQLRAHPLGPWIAATVGVGEKQGARLLAAIGDPYWNDLHGRPRAVSELWSYCGSGDAAQQVKKAGHKVNWSPAAKMRAHLISEACMKSLRSPCGRAADDLSWAEHVDGCTCSPYRLVYDQERRKYAGSVHPDYCKRCGPAGHPAVPGSERSAAHLHAIGLRHARKELLKDLWREARRLHGVTDIEEET